MIYYVQWATLVVASIAIIRSWALERRLTKIQDDLDEIRRLCTALAMDSIHGNAERAKMVIGAATLRGERVLE